MDEDGGFEDFLALTLSRYTYNASQKILTYVERLRARKRGKIEKERRENSSVRVEEDGKMDLREKEERLMAKARYFTGTKANARYVGFLHICTRVALAIQTQVESRLNEF